MHLTKPPLSGQGIPPSSSPQTKYEGGAGQILCIYQTHSGTECDSELRTLFPLTAFKNAPNPKFVQNLSRRLFFGVPIRGTQICQKFAEKLKNDNFRTIFQFFDKFLTNLGRPDCNPEKQSLGQILDKFGVRGVFECCKGKKGSQILNRE